MRCYAPARRNRNSAAAAIVGKVVPGSRYVARYRGDVVMDVDLEFLTGGVRYNRPYTIALPNATPQTAALPRFHTTMSEYFEALLGLGERLMRGMAISLDLPENNFKAFCTEPMATLRLLHYPPQRPDDPNQRGAGAHTDFGGLTLLRQDGVGGLQVWDQESQGWIHADPVPGTFIVNLGDMIARWTNDRYRSTVHRVVNTSGRERYSVPFFYTGNYTHTVACIPTCLAPGETPKYPPITVGDHLREMYRRTYKG